MALGLVLIIITGIVSTLVMIILLRKYENTERMSMIEKGMDASIFAKPRPNKGVSGALRASLLFIGAGVGLLLGYLLDRQFEMEVVAYFSMLFICGGLGLVTAYLIEGKKLRKREQDKNL